MSWYTKQVDKLSHYPLRYLRRLAKELIILFPIGLIAIIAFNAFTPQPQFEKLKTEVVLNPRSVEKKLQLANFLYQKNNFVSSETELQKILMSPKITTEEKFQAKELLIKIEKEKNSPQEISQQISFWQKQIAKYPNSRDSFLALAIFNWKLYRSFDAIKFIDQAMAIDPNSEVVMKISQTLR